MSAGHFFHFFFKRQIFRRRSRREYRSNSRKLRWCRRNYRSPKVLFLFFPFLPHFLRT
jgi:hypothetical protein